MDHTEYMAGKCWSKFGQFTGNSEIIKSQRRG